MEEPSEEPNVAPELYFLIAKFLSGGPLQHTAKAMLTELERAEVLPRRLDWEGREHKQTYHELASQYSDMSWGRLARVCERALQLARLAAAAPDAGALRGPRLSLLSEALLAPRAPADGGHSLVRRLTARAEGGSGAVFPARMLRALQLQRRTLGHLSAVYCLVFDCTGRYVVTGADDLLVKAWSALDGRLLATFRGAAAEITDVCVSHDNRLLAAGSVERLVRVWCLASGAPVAVLAAHAGTITSVHFRPSRCGDLRCLASTSTDGSVAFWTYRQAGPGGKPAFLSAPVQYVERMRPGICHMICAAWSAGGAFLAAGSADHHVRLYALHDAGPRRVLEVAAHSDAVDSLCWAHAALRFVSGSKDGTAALWSLHATQWRHTRLRMDEEPSAARLKVTMVCWDRSDALVITAVSDCTVRVWCARSCRPLRALRGHTDEAYVLEAHPFIGGVLLSAGHDGQLFVWDAHSGEALASFHNRIEGQGSGALFDAKWGAGDRLAATDSHGHLLLLGLGTGHPLLRTLPTELFFHTDYRPVARDALGGALDEQTEVPPHLMPPPFLVDVEGAPHAPLLQRLVPGREKLSLSQLIPLTDEPPRSRLDDMIEALARGEFLPHDQDTPEARGVWRGEGVRHTAGSWQRGEPLDAPHLRRPLVPPLPPAQQERVDAAAQEMYAAEVAAYRREMRRRPLMISTAESGAPRGPRKRPGRARRVPGAPPRPRPAPRPEPEPELEADPFSTGDDSSDSSVHLPVVQRRRRRPRSSSDLTETTSTDSKSATDDSSSSSSDCSDWVAKSGDAALAPPARSRRRPIARKRYSPSAAGGPKRRERPAAANGPSTSAAAAQSSPSPPEEPPTAEEELSELFRPGEWLTAVAPRKAPYHPQMGDECLYFRLGHQRYFEAVAEKDLYKVNPRDKPWERTNIHECELVKVVGMKYIIKPPRVVSLKLASLSAPPKTFTVKYHDMPDVIDFLVLRQQYEAAAARGWAPGDRFRCIIDDSWWAGSILESLSPPAAPAAPAPPASGAAAQWAACASHFLSLRVRWDNSEVERLSPWDLEPPDPARMPRSPGGAVPVLEHELRSVLYRPAAHEWPPRGEQEAACARLAELVSQAMSLAAAEPFVAPVDLARYPSYARLIAYPVDLSTIRARFQNRFYRRAAAAQFDARYLAANAERFNEPHSSIVRRARLLSDLLLHAIANWREADLLAEYRRLAAAYRSEPDDEEPVSVAPRPPPPRWRDAAGRVLRELIASADALPFRAPVSLIQAPDYAHVVARPMDLGTIERRFQGGDYATPAHLAEDVRLVFANSRLYNTNKRSRIYSMTVRLSALFEAQWSRAALDAGSGAAGGGGRSPRPARRAARRAARRQRRQGGQERPAEEAAQYATSDEETLAATSRRVHGTSATSVTQSPTRASSSDSDAPLKAHTKGKGVGKKSKHTSALASDDTSIDHSQGEPSRAVVATSRPMLMLRSHSNTGSDSIEYENIEVLEEEIELTSYENDGPELGQPDDDDADGGAATTSPRPRHRARVAHTQNMNGTGGSRKRRRSSGSDNSHSPRQRSRSRSRSGSESESGSDERWEDPRTSSRRRKKKRRKPAKATPQKRTRERVLSGTSDSSAWSSDSAAGARGARAAADGPSGGRRYESDHSYRPRYSSDDDAPLHVYRQRHDGPTDRHNGEAGSSGRSRRQLPETRYNEDSEEDSAIAISKRLHHHHLHQRRHEQCRRALAERLRGGAGGGRGHFASRSTHTQDHNYFNGHAEAHSSRAPPEPAPEPDEPVSISSRGRVRRLTAKARGLLAD